MPDAIVIGAGPNGLVAAIRLADAGREVLVLEAQPDPGGAVRTAELTAPGFRHDVYSAFYPFAVASPALASLELERHGLRWRRAPLAVAHPAVDGSCAVLSQDLEETAASLDAFAPGDGDAWRRLFAAFARVERGLVQALVTPMPPVLPGLRIAAALRSDTARFLRFLALPVRRMAEEEFRGDGGGRLLAGHAAHADIPPEAPGSGAFGWVLAMLGQRHGFPTPEGGAGELTAALVRRLRAAGGALECSAPVVEVLVRGGRATGVRTADGRVVRAGTVLADVTAPALYGELLAPEHVPARVREDMRRFQHDAATFKVDWALDGPIPWTAAPARRAGVVHVSEGIDELTETYAHIARGLIPASPGLVMGQYSMVDGTRQPDGAETAWAYTQLPRAVRGDAGGAGLGGGWPPAEAGAFADRLEARIEALAPGFRSRIRARHLLTPANFADRDANLPLGAMHGGTTQLHQQAIFRPLPGFGRPETPVRGLFLASASVHPGGGVHGGPGANAARAALRRARRPRASARGRGGS